MPQNQDEILLTRFEEALTASALSSSTIVNYLADLRAFLRWGKAEVDEQFSLPTVTQEHIRLYRYHLAQELKRAASTVNRHLMALRKFFNFASRVDAVPFDPTAGVSLVQNTRQIMARPLSDDEIQKLLAAAENGSRAGLVRRDLAILHLLLHTGLRVSEIVNLQQDDLIFDNPGIRIKVCTGHNRTCSRYLPLPDTLRKVLYDYLRVRPRTAGAEYLFLSQDGRPISSRTVQRIISDCARAAGLKGVSAQSLRRTFAVRLLAQTNNLSLVSERLGHQNKSITEQYLAL